MLQVERWHQKRATRRAFNGLKTSSDSVAETAQYKPAELCEKYNLRSSSVNIVTATDGT
jgi:hypothetical protein